jgi:hypothetical protein
MPMLTGAAIAATGICLPSVDGAAVGEDVVVEAGRAVVVGGA